MNMYYYEFKEEKTSTPHSGYVSIEEFETSEQTQPTISLIKSYIKNKYSLSDDTVSKGLLIFSPSEFVQDQSDSQQSVYKPRFWNEVSQSSISNGRLIINPSNPNR